MRLRQVEGEPGGEQRYDAATLQKVTSLAARLQSDDREKLTAQEMEAVGAEVGLEPAFIREALGRYTRPEEPAPRIPLAAYAGAWWAGGWSLPIVSAAALGNRAGGVLFFLFLGLYLAGGILLSLSAGREKERRRSAVSRESLMEMLATLRQGMEERDEHRAFLSVDVIGAGGYATERLAHRLADVVNGCGGSLQSSGVAGTVFVFRTDTEAAYAARRLQEALPALRREAGQRYTPLQLRCGISAGEVVLDQDAPSGYRHGSVIEHATALQQQAAPGEVLIGGEVSAAALAALPGATLQPEPAAGAPAFSWRGVNAPSPPAAGE